MVSIVLQVVIKNFYLFIFYRESMLKEHFSSYSWCPKIAQLNTLRLDVLNPFLKCILQHFFHLGDEELRINTNLFVLQWVSFCRFWISHVLTWKNSKSVIICETENEKPSFCSFNSCKNGQSNTQKLCSEKDMRQINRVSVLLGNIYFDLQLYLFKLVLAGLSHSTVRGMTTEGLAM